MVGKAKQQTGMCEFMVYPAEGTGYGARMYEGEAHKCGRPAVARREGKNVCGRHDSELSPRDMREIEVMADSDGQDAEEVDQRAAAARYSPFQRPILSTDALLGMRARIEERRQQREAERAQRQAEIARRAAEWRERNTRTCVTCGRQFTLHPRFEDGECWRCRSARRQEQRQAERATRFGMIYGRSMPLNVQPDPPKPPEPPAKPLQEHFNTKRKFLKW